MEEALKLITSGGLITPDDSKNRINGNGKSASAGEQIICVNRQARHNYFIDETFEAGLVLVGSEVKSLRDGKANLKDSYARIQKGEAFLVNSHVSAYPGANQFNHEPTRRAKACSCTNARSNGSPARPRNAG